MSLDTAAPPAPPRPASRAARPVGQHAHRDQLARGVIGALLWGAVALVTYWWVADGALSQLGTFAGAFTEVGRWTGLTASVLLLAQVVAMSRLPFVERAYGQDKLAEHHRWLGFTSFNMMVAHIVFISIGYAGSVGGAPGTLWNVTLTYPGMLLAAAGTACLVMVVVTSVKAARKKLRYESWHLLHLYAYLGVGLALPHQLWTGENFTSSPARTLFWWTAWAAAAAAVLIWRVGRPVAKNLRHQFRVAAVVPEAPGVVSVYVSGRQLERFGAEAGQWATWRFLGRRGWTRANPYSFSAAPHGQHLRVTVADAGDGSRSVSDLRVGQRVFIEGPYGRLTQRASHTSGAVLIGAGVGIAPLRALAESLPASGVPVTLVHRFSRHELFGPEFSRIADVRGLDVVRSWGARRAHSSWLGQAVDGPRSMGAEPVRTKDSVDDLGYLRWWVPDLAQRDVYLCGPVPWTDQIVADLRRGGVPESQIHVEKFGW